MNTLSIVSKIALLVCQGTVYTLAQENSTKILENERVVVWRVGSDTPQSSPALQLRFPAVLISLDDGAIRFTNATEASAIQRGSGRTLLIAIKDHRVSPLEAPKNIARAFPRQGARRIVDNNLLNVWDFTWTKGMKTPVHFHDKDVVVVYLADGALTSTTPDHVSTVNEHFFGFTKFNPGNRVHSELLSRGSARAIIIELK